VASGFALACKSTEEQAVEAARAYIEEWRARQHVDLLWEEQLKALKERIADEKEFENEVGYYYQYFWNSNWFRFLESVLV
jgi:hypothetical protein